LFVLKEGFAVDIWNKFTDTARNLLVILALIIIPYGLYLNHPGAMHHPSKGGE